MQLNPLTGITSLLARTARGARVCAWLIGGAGLGLVTAPGMTQDAGFTDLDDVIQEQVEARAEETIADDLHDVLDVFLTDITERAFDDQIDGQVERTVEQIIEDYAEEVAQAQIEERIGSDIQDILDGSIDELLDGAVEDSVEQVVEETVEDNVESVVEESVEDTVEESVAENVEETLEENVEESVAENIEDTVEESVEELVVDHIEESITESVEETLEESLEEAVAGAIEDNIEEQVADTVEENLEEQVASTVEGTVEEAIEASVEELAEATVEDSLEQSVEAGLEFAVEEQITERVEDKLEAELEDKLEADEQRIHTDQWLVMAEPEVFVKLAAEGYIFDAVTDLPGLGLQLAEVAAPGSFDISAARQGVVDVVGRDRVEVDLNHIYTAGVPVEQAEEVGVAPREALDFPADTDDMSLSIGMIDSQVDTEHPSLSSPRIQTRDFTGSDDVPQAHGTAIASIIAGDDEGYRGLVPGAQLYAASVFQNDSEHGEIASTLSLVRALDWLVSSEVDVVNISLAGPPNRLLEAALKKVTERDVMLVAAAGNGGPVAKPMYPAAYESVVAVTAVSAGGKVFRLANRGAYLDLAAPGVDLRHARSGGGYTASSGTSFAVPFAAAAAARLRYMMPGQDVAQLLFSSAQDLGPPGRDPIYGHGLLQPQLGSSAVATLEAPRPVMSKGPAGP